MRLEQIDDNAVVGAYTSTPPTRRRSWPDAVTFRESIQHPAAAIGDPGLRSATVSLDRMGMPLSYSGRFAIVFRLMSDGGEKWAFRCFTSPGEDGVGHARAVRYRTIEEHTARMPNTFVPFRYVDSGIKVGQEWFPSLVMRWAPGQPLGKWVEGNLQNPESLLTLCGALSGLLERLEEAGIAHGDWQHDNLIVSDSGQLVTLVDYDGMYVPEFAGQQCPEMGHPNYQHPARSSSHFGPGLDRFPCLVVETALLALARDPFLWARFSDGESLLFKHHDLADPDNSPVFAAVRATAVSLGDETLAESLLRLRDACLAGAESTLLPAIAAAAPPPPIFKSADTSPRVSAAIGALSEPGMTARSVQVIDPLYGPKWWQIPEAAPAATTWYAAPTVSAVTTKPTRRTYTAPSGQALTYVARLNSFETLHQEQAHFLRWRCGGTLFFTFLTFVLYHWLFQGGYPPLYFLWVLNFAPMGYNRWPRQQIAQELHAEIDKMENLIRDRTRRMDALTGGTVATNVTLPEFTDQWLRDTPITRAFADLVFSPSVVRQLRNVGINDALALKQNAHSPKLGQLPYDQLTALEHWYHAIETKATEEYQLKTVARPALTIEVDRLRHEIAEFERHTSSLKKERDMIPDASFSAYIRKLFGGSERPKPGSAPGALP